MQNRFSGQEGSRLLREALKAQGTLECSEPVVESLARVAKVKDYAIGEPLIIQDSEENSIGFILNGSVDVQIGKTTVARRKAGDHVGEMAVLDPTARRSASIIATAETCVAWVDEKDFEPIATENPFIWRRIAIEISNRLRERGALVRAKNDRPLVFVGSSSQSLSIARSIKKKIANSTTDVSLWEKGVFGLSDTSIESLEQTIKKADFAVFVLTADDKISGARISAPRDNVILELGMAIGAMERRRAFMVVEDARIKIPSDLAGVTYVKFSRSSQAVLRKDLNNAAKLIVERITERGPR